MLSTVLPMVAASLRAGTIALTAGQSSSSGEWPRR